MCAPLGLCTEIYILGILGVITFFAFTGIGDYKDDYFFPQTPVSDFSGIPQEQLDRVARIYVPAKNVMQSGNWNTREWRLDFEAQERWENPLMGWTSRFVLCVCLG